MKSTEPECVRPGWWACCDEQMTESLKQTKSKNNSKQQNQTNQQNKQAQLERGAEFFTEWRFERLKCNVSEFPGVVQNFNICLYPPCLISR